MYFTQAIFARHLENFKVMDSEQYLIQYQAQAAILELAANF